MPFLRTPLFTRGLSLFALVFLCSACVSNSAKEAENSPASESRDAPKSATPVVLDKAQQELANGIASYENGAYKQAVRQLQSALALGLEARADKARTHKYLAFMQCVSGRERLCREEFRKALDADPAFDLTPAESGHPTWGPVFRKLKTTGKPAAK